MYNMWQQGVISEEDYRNGAAQPLVLAEEDSGKKPSIVGVQHQVFHLGLQLGIDSGFDGKAAGVEQLL